MKNPIPKNTICVWFDREAEEAARFYASVFPDSAVGSVMRAPAAYPSGKEGDVLVVEFTVCGIPCIGLNGGPGITPSIAFSFQIATDTQEETDRYWNAIVGNGGEASECGWCQDRWGISWQITPRTVDRGDVQRWRGSPARLRGDDDDGPDRRGRDRRGRDRRRASRVAPEVLDIINGILRIS